MNENKSEQLAKQNVSWNNGWNMNEHDFGDKTFDKYKCVWGFSFENHKSGIHLLWNMNNENQSHSNKSASVCINVKLKLRETLELIKFWTYCPDSHRFVVQIWFRWLNWLFFCSFSPQSHALSSATKYGCSLHGNVIYCDNYVDASFISPPASPFPIFNNISYWLPIAEMLAIEANLLYLKTFLIKTLNEGELRVKWKPAPALHELRP